MRNIEKPVSGAPVNELQLSLHFARRSTNPTSGTASPPSISPVLHVSQYYTGLPTLNRTHNFQTSYSPYTTLNDSMKGTTDNPCGMRGTHSMLALMLKHLEPVLLWSMAEVGAKTCHSIQHCRIPLLWALKRRHCRLLNASRVPI